MMYLLMCLLVKAIIRRWLIYLLGSSSVKCLIALYKQLLLNLYNIVICTTAMVLVVYIKPY